MDMKEAVTALTEFSYTCILFHGNAVFYSKDRGVKPLLQFLDSGAELRGFSAADKVVGRATAFLYSALGVTRVHALVLSQPAAEVLESRGIVYSYDLLVPGIRNRENTGPCPMENATANCQTPEEAVFAIRAKLKQLQGA